MSSLKNKIINIVSHLLEVAIVVFSSIAFSNTYLSVKTTEMNMVNDTCQSAKSDYYFANIDFKDENKKKIPESLFRNSYSKNFAGTSTRMLTVSGDDGIVSFKTFYNDLELPYYSSPVNGLNYTNSKEKVMLETVCINLLIYREKSEEIGIDYRVYDGFIYIPDYYADYIIENTEDINNYVDLFDNERTNNIVFEYRDRLFKYKIANIFHVNGFNSKYAGDITINYCDYNNGKKLDSFFNGFCFVSNYDHYTLFDDRFHTTYFLQIGPKKYELEENLIIANNYKKMNNAISANASIYYHCKDGLFEYKNSQRLSDLFFGNHSNEVNGWALAIALVLLTLNILVSIFNFFGKFGFSDGKKYFLVSTIVVPFILLISFFVKRIWRSNYAINCLLNPYVSMVCLLLMIAFFIGFILLISKKEKKE